MDLLEKDLVLGNEQLIFNQNGQPQFVVISFERYQFLLEVLEDYGLGQAILEVEDEPRFSKEEAILLLEEDETFESPISRATRLV